MQFTTLTFASSALLAAALVAAQSGISVATLPAITTCIANRLTWTGGSPPYNVFVIVPQQSSQILQSLGTTNSNFLVWTPDGSTSGIRAGDSVAIYVVDSQGVNNGSAGTQVISGGTCTGSTSGTSSAAAPAGSTSSTSSSAPAASTAHTSSSGFTASSTASSSRPNATTASTTSPSASSTPSGAAAPGLKVSGGLIAGVVGLLAAALV